MSVVGRPRPGLLKRFRLLLRSQRELARLNHILIPADKAQRDKLRKKWRWRLASLFFALHGAFSREGRALSLITVMVGCAGLDVTRTQVHWLSALLFGLLCGSLMIRPFFRTKDLVFSVSASPRVAVGSRQKFVIRLGNEGTRPLLGLRVMGPFLPWDGAWRAQPAGVAMLEASARTSVVAEARFLARGEHHLDAFEVAALVPLGLTTGPRRQSDGVRFLVVPRVAKLAPLQLSRRRADKSGTSLTTRAAGESEIDTVRPYRPGDPLKHLHARTWARTGEPHVRTYVTERNIKVGLALAIDGDLAMEREKEAAISLAAGVAAKLASGEGIDLLSIDERGFRIAPRVGHAALDATLDKLAVHVIERAERDFASSLEEHARSLSSLVLVTADEDERRHELVKRLALSGLEVLWLAVSTDGSSGRAGAVRRIPMASIEADEVIVP